MGRIVLFLIGLLLMASGVMAAIIQVGPGQTYTTIQAAVNAASAGDEIQVAAGTYTEAITIPIGKALTITGANAGTAAGNNPGVRGTETILNGGFYLNSASTIDGFTINNGSSSGSIINGVTVASPGVTVKNCIIQNVTGSQNNGIETTSVNNFTLHNSTIQNNWRGIYFNPGSGHVLTGNLITANNGSGVGIGSDGLSNFSMTGNTISNHTLEGWGASAVGANVVAENNSFLNNGVSVAHYSGTAIDASPNYWNGSPSTSGTVTNDPWWSDAAMTILASNMPVRNLTQSLYYSTIQAAIDAATSGDVISVSNGTYNERLVITKSLTLQGANEATTIIDGSTFTSAGRGILINNGVTNVTIQNLTVQNFIGSDGNTHGGIYAIGGNNYLTIQNVTIKDNRGTSTSGSGFYANGPIDNVVLDHVTSSGHYPGARGIVIWNGLKSNITITNCEVFNNNCCGIELQDGTASGVTMENNLIYNNADNGIGVVGLQGPGENLIKGNTLTNNGRFGIEVKNPDGSGLATGAGRIVVENNTVTRNTAITDLRDLAGIAVMRRGVLAGNVDIPKGVVVQNNTVSGYTQTSTSDGFGIVIGGMNHTVSGNTLSGNDVGLQQQAGHLPYPADGDQNNLSDQYFGRDNSPFACGNALTGNIYSGNTADYREVGGPFGSGKITNLITGTEYCSIQAAIDGATAGDVIEIDGMDITVSASINVNKSITLQPKTAGNTTITGTSASAVPVFIIQANNVIIQGLNITLSQAGLDAYTGYDGLIQVPQITGGYTGIQILSNTIWTPLQGARNTMSTWKAFGVKIDRYSSATISGNTIFNTRQGISGGYGTSLIIQNNNIYNTKGGVCIYTNQGDIASHTISGNTWNAPVATPELSHSEWDITWHSGGTYTSTDWSAHYATYVYALSLANDNGYVVDRRGEGSVQALGGNRSHVFVDASSSIIVYGSGTGSFNDPLATIALGIQSVVTQGKILVAAGTYAENVSVSRAMTLQGANADIPCGSRGAESIIAPASGLPVSITADGVTLNGFEITAPGATYAVNCGNKSNVNVLFNNIHHIGTTLTGANVHAIMNQIGSGSTSNLSITDNCLDNISHSGLTEYSASGIGILQSVSTGTLDGLTIARNQINNVNVNTGNWPTGKIAYGIQINVGGGSAYLTNGKVLDANVNSNIISNLTGFIATGIALEGNTEDAVVANNDVSFLTGNKLGDRAGGGYDLQALKFESNRYVQTCTIENNAFRANTFTHGTGGAGVGYAVANYVPVGGTYTGGTTGAATLGCNWLGSDHPEVLADNATFTGKIFNKDGCLTHFLPALASGTDTDINTPGFQPATGTCTVKGPVSIGGTQYATLQQALDAANDGDVITVLAGGTYGGVTFNNPGETVTLTTASGVSVTIVGASPALTVNAGDLIVKDGISFTTATDDPTILVNGGSLTMTDCSITESTAYNQTGVMVSGGTVNLGTLATPGHNTFITDGTGKAVTNNTTTAVDAIGNYWGTVDPTAVAALISGTTNYSPWCNEDFSICGYTAGSPVTTIGIPTEVSCGVYDFPVTVQNFNNIGAISLTLNYDPAVLSYTSVVLNGAITGAPVSNPLPGTFILGYFESTVGSISLADDAVLFTLRFTLLPAASGAASVLSWNTSDPAYCEYGGVGPNFDPYVSAFINLSTWNIPVRPVKNVNTSLEYCKIQEAIDDPLTLNGHVITVAAGTYTENVTVNKELTITGAGSASTTINASPGIAVEVTADHVIIQGFTIQHSTITAQTDLGIRLNQSDNSKIQNCLLKLNSVGLQLLDAGNNDILSNEFTSNAVGIYFEGTMDGSGTEITNPETPNGPFYSLSLNNTVQFNNIHDNILIGGQGGQGIYLDAVCDNNVFDQNTISGNVSVGFYAWKASFSTITNNTISNNGTEGGIQLMGSSSNIITGNTVTNNANNGIWLRAGALSSTSNTITGNTITGNNTGIMLYDSQDAGYVGVVSGNTISNNIIAGNTSYGIQTFDVPVGQIYIAENNWWGDASGPYCNPYNTCGLGNAVTPNVDFLPWYKDAALTTLTNANGDLLVHNIDMGTYYCKIQDAIDDASTLNGHVIEVSPGTFDEQVLVNKGLTIKGVGLTKPIIDYSGTVTGKPGLFDISVDNVIIENLNFKVDLSKLRSAIIASGAGIDNISVKSNLIEPYGTASGTYGDRNAVSINYGGPTNYRTASGGVNNILYQDNTVTMGAAGGFRAAIAIDEGNATITGNTATTINHDVLLRFSSGAVTVTGNTCYGGGMEFSDFNAGTGTLTISNNTFDGTITNAYTNALRLKNNYTARTTIVSNNTFTHFVGNIAGYGGTVSLENYQAITLDGNTFTPLANSTTFRHITINTKDFSSSSGHYTPVVGATLTNNIFNGSGTPGGVALSFYNWDNDSPTFNAFELGTAGNENTFNAGIGTFILLDNSDGTVLPNNTTMVPWAIDLDATNNKFDVGAGLELPAAMSLENLFALEDKIQHAIDDGDLGFVKVKDLNTYVTPGSFIAPATTTPSIQRGIDAASNGWTVNVTSGTFTENILIGKPLTLLGANANIPCAAGRGAETVIQPSSAGTTPVSLTGAGSSDNVTINGFEITGTMSNNAIYCGGDGPSGLKIIFNYIHDIGTGRGSGNVYAINYRVNDPNTSNVNISDNCIENVLNNTSLALGNSAAIWLGQSTATGVVSNLTIQRNIIKNIFSYSTKDVSGIYLGVASGTGTGGINIPLISENEISNIRGGIAYGVQLSGKTPGAIVRNNIIDNVTSSTNATYVAGVAALSTNTGSATITINENSFTNTLNSIVNGTASAISSTCNWYGNSSVATASNATIGLVTYEPWLVTGTDNDVAIGFQPVPNSCTGAANLYVNDLVSDNGTNDIYTTAIGADANAGTAAAPFLTITKAVNTAVDGTQIWVDAGTFQEQVFIGKTVDITGADYTKTSVKAPVALQTTPISIWSANEAVNPIIFAYDNTKTINLSKLTVDGDGGRTVNKYFGVLFYEANGSFTFGKITGIRDAGSFSGAQAGIAYYGGHIRTASLTQNLAFTNNIVDDFQKGGVVVDAPGTIGIIDNNTIIGQNVPLVTAQNGIQLSRGAGGSIQGNTVSNCIWNKVEHPHQYTAAGILLYQAGATTVSGNTLSGNELALNSYGSAGVTYGVNTFSNNKIHLWLDAVSDINAANVYDKYVLDPTNNPEVVFGCIQYAIDEATAGDLLNASAGTFIENVNVHTSVSLNGAASLASIIDGGGAGTVVTIAANNTTLNGFKVQNSGATATDAGVKLTDGGMTGVTGCTITNNEITTFNGLGIIGGSANSLTLNNIHNNAAYGALLIGTSGNTIESNTISNTGLDGIALDNASAVGGPLSIGSTGNFIKSNTISNGSRDGIFIGENCSGNYITDGNVLNTIASIGINVWRPSGQTITDNSITNALTGIRLLGSSNNTITGNTLTTNGTGIIIDPSWQSGVWYSSNNNTISGNTIAGNTLGMDADDVNQNLVTAEINWWGDASGPYHATLNPCGLGNAVTDNVDFSPWYFQSGMTTLNGLSPVAVTTTENVSTVTATPVVFNTTVAYGSDITNYDPAILADARITSNPAFPAGAQVIGVKYNGTDVLPAAFSLTGTQAYLSDILAGSPYPLNQHNNVTDVWEVIVAGFNSDLTYAISMDAVSYTGTETNCNTVRGSDAFNVTFAPVVFTYTPETPVCELNPVNVPYTETYPLVENNGGYRVLNDSKWEFYTDAGMTTPFALPIGTKITVGQVNGPGAFTWSSTSTLTTAVSSLYGSAVVTGQGNPSTYDYGQLVALTRPAVTNDWMAILEGVPAGTYYVKVKNLAMLDPDGLQYVPTWPHGTFTEFVYDEQSFQVVVNDCGISGVLTYYNNAASLLKNVPISLYQNGNPVLDGSSNPIVSTTDGTTAAYTFPGLPAGTYELRPAKTDEVRSINATDAAQVNYWQVNAPTVYAIEKVRFLAGDVDRSTPNGTPFTTVSNSYLTSSDASRILQYFVTAGNLTWANANAWSFWKAGDMQSDKGWLESAYPNLEITNAPLTNQTLYGMVTGDFNRSWTSSSKGQGMNLSLQEGQNVQVAASTEVLLPVTAGMPMEVGAISLILNYPDDKVTVEAVYLGNNPNQPLLFSATNGVLRIGWTSAMSVYLNTGETLLTLKLRTASVLGNNELIRFVLDGDPLNELADGDGIVVPNALLIADNLVTSLTGLDDLSGNGLMIRNYPNPFSEQTTFVYYLPTSGKVCLEVFDVTGRMVTEVTEANTSAGSHTYMLEAGSLTPGIYTARLSFTAGGKALTRTLKLILQD